MTSFTLRDVTLRDGLQDETPIPTATKVELFEALVAAGVRDLELTSFVRPDRVPAPLGVAGVDAGQEVAGVGEARVVAQQARADRAVGVHDLADEVRAGDLLPEFAGRPRSGGDQSLDLELAGVDHQADHRLLVVGVAVLSTVRLRRRAHLRPR